jgi:hypothetical protein
VPEAKGDSVANVRKWSLLRADGTAVVTGSDFDVALAAAAAELATDPRAKFRLRSTQRAPAIVRAR